MNYLQWGHIQVWIYPGYRGLLNVCGYLTLHPKRPAYMIEKAHRWAISMLFFDLVKEHKDERGIVFATQFPRNLHRQHVQRTLCRYLAELHKWIIPFSARSFEIDTECVKALQRDQPHLKEATGSTDGNLEKQNIACIPDEATKHKTKIPITIHSGSIVHCQEEVTEDIFRRSWFRPP